MYILIKARPNKPPNPKILVGEDEFRMKKWANRKAAEMLRAEGKPPSGPEWDALRNQIIEQLKEDPQQHGASFLGDIPEDWGAAGQRHQPDIEEEQAAIDDKFSGRDDDMQEAHNEAARAHEIEEEMTHGKDESEIDRQAIDNAIDDAYSGAFPPHQPFLPSSEEEEEKPKPDPGQKTLFDFGLENEKKAFPMRHAWDMLKNW